MRLSHIVFSVLWVGLLLTAGGARGADGPRPVEDVYKLLLEKNVPIDVDKTRKVTVESLTRAVDPGSMLYTPEDYHKLLMEKSIESVEEWREDLCYLKLKGIYRDAGDEVAALLRKWKAAGKAGVILDLREAVGESLLSVDALAPLYVSGDPLLYQIKDHRGSVVQNHRLKVDSALLGGTMPLILLQSKTTGGAAEVLAALLKGRKGVLIIGTRTRGDASVRENIQLSPDEILHIATRRIVMNGTQFEVNGVQPDVLIDTAGKAAEKIPEKRIELKIPSAKAKFDRELMERVFSDPVLLRATDVLLAMKALTPYGNEIATDSPSPSGKR